MAIWIFGDSFAARKGGMDSYPGWYNIVPSTLNQNLLNHAVFGASFHYVRNKFLEVESQITSDDIVIILLTGADRAYLFNDKPGLSFPWFIDKVSYNQEWLDLDEERQQAFKLYFKHLHQNENVRDDVKIFLKMLDSNPGKYGKVLVIKTYADYRDIKQEDYKNLKISSGKSFIEISTSEPGFDFKKVFGDPDCFDKRNCHLSEENHRRVADIILKAIQEDADLVF